MALLRVRNKMISAMLSESPTDEAASELEESFVHCWEPFVSYAQATKLMQPSKSAFHHPAGFAQTAAVLGAPAGNLRLDASAPELGTQTVGVISPIGLKRVRPALGRAPLTADGGHRVEQVLGLGNVVPVCFGQNDGNRDALCFREEVVFAARTTAIGWVRSTFFPAPIARTEELSAMAREKSSLFAPRNWLSNTWCSRSQTRALCHARSRRQQVMPDPQPISCGSIFQGMPERKTNRMPLSALRSQSGRLPAYRLRRFFFGSSGSICFHSSSSTSRCAIA